MTIDVSSHETWVVDTTRVSAFVSKLSASDASAFVSNRKSIVFSERSNDDVTPGGGNPPVADDTGVCDETVAAVVVEARLLRTGALDIEISSSFISSNANA